MDRYAELQQLQQESRRVNAKSRYMEGKWMQMLCWLDCHMSEHCLVERDIIDTFAFAGLFFPGEKYGEYIASWRKRLPGRTKLVDNEFKAGQLPYYRVWRSITTMPESFWPPARGLDAFRPPGKADSAREWDAITRPLLARRYKAGIIAPFFDADSKGAIG
ncbi:hypothetical protein AC579_4596 [Pseudocercospora musae]|uniref:Uncharacterized protein n=1 Tax=Pseudocercospora musae TaxID=113226 RepID=A0A139ITU2_9PEZI|nr:hypothetical protein AC579_4596 [Pseudocercospora musae]